MQQPALSALLPTYTALAHATLQTELLALSRKLVFAHALDYTVVPKPVQRSFDDLFFGGALFDCKPFAASEVSTQYGIYFTVLALAGADGFLLLGPYLAEDAPAPVADGDFTVPERQAFAEYLQYLPILSQESIRAFFNAILLHFDAQPLTGLGRDIALSAQTPPPCPVLSADSIQAQADSVAARYRLERQFLESVAKGQPVMPEQAMQLGLLRLPNKMRNHKSQLIILNTLLRKTIEQVGVHPYYIDRVSAKWFMLIEQATTMNALERIVREMIPEYSGAAKKHALAEYSPLVRGMLQAIAFNLENPKLNLGFLAQALGASQSHLSRQFHKEVQMGVPEYITQQRIRAAKKQLQHAERPIGDIAASVGFVDANYFAKVFRQQTGQTPSGYARDHR